MSKEGNSALQWAFKLHSSKLAVDMPYAKG